MKISNKNSIQILLFTLIIGFSGCDSLTRLETENLRRVYSCNIEVSRAVSINTDSGKRKLIVLTIVNDEFFGHEYLNYPGLLTNAAVVFYKNNNIEADWEIETRLKKEHELETDSIVGLCFNGDQLDSIVFEYKSINYFIDSFIKSVNLEEIDKIKSIVNANNLSNENLKKVILELKALIQFSNNHYDIISYSKKYRGEGEVFNIGMIFSEKQVRKLVEINLLKTDSLYSVLSIKY